MQTIGAVRRSRLLGGIFLASLAPSALSATNWDMTFNSAPNSGLACHSSGSSVGNVGTCSSTATGSDPKPTASLAAWSTTGSGGSFAAANLAWYSGGFGVRNASGSDTTDPQHSMDNSGATDLIAFSFSQSVAISSVNFGWISGDNDFSLLRWVGAGTPDFGANKDLAGKVIGAGANFTSTGSSWELVSNHKDPGVGPESVNSAGKTSSWWLISAYNAGYGSCGTNCGAGNDYMKLLAVAGTASTNVNVPEPGSLVLAGMALLAVVGTRRKLPS